MNFPDLLEGALPTKHYFVQRKNKIRPKDDHKANIVNHSDPLWGATIHAIDHVASMLAEWLKASKDKVLPFGSIASETEFLRMPSRTSAAQADMVSD